MNIINSITVEGVAVHLELRSDGIYLILNRPAGNANLVDFASVRTLIESTGIQNWDFAAALEVTESLMPQMEIRVSPETELKKVDETAVVTIASDKMSAEIVFTQPIFGGRAMTTDDIYDALHAARVTDGIDKNAINRLSKDRKYLIAYIVASGKRAENGEDGFIEYFFNTGKITRAPKELEDGKIDYLNIDYFQVTPKGSVLAKITPPKEGVDGYNIVGEPIKASQGKAVVSPVGKNVCLGEDGESLIAEVAGQILFQNGKISVSPILELAGNVDNSTGNINFLGTVIVKKNVLTGFTVTTTGNVEVNGVVEGATINCEGDLVIRGGVQGMNKANLTAKGTISAKFIENAVVQAGVDVIADSIVRSAVKCGGSLILSGKRGQLIGGSVKVLNSVTANILGSQVEASTEVQAGLDPDLFDLYMKSRAELAKLKKELTQLTQIINTLAHAREQGTLTEPKKAILVKSLQSKTHIKAKTVELYSEIEELIPQLTKGAGIIRVQKMVNPGVKITIGNAILYVRDRLENCSFSNVDGEIRLGQF